MWCKIKEIDPSYRQFLTPKQLSALGLSPIKAETQQNATMRHTHTVNQQKDLTDEIPDEDTIILVIPPYEDLQSESPDCYRNPHKLP